MINSELYTRLSWGCPTHNWRITMIKPTFLRRVAIAALLTGSCFSTVAAPPVSYGVEEDVFHPVRAKQGMVASVDATATQVGVDILKEGGNAVDAAVAVG